MKSFGFDESRERMKFLEDNNVVIDGEEYEIVDEINENDDEYEYEEVKYYDPSSYTLKAIDLLIQNEVTTNVHYVLSNSSIDEAIELLQNDGFPKGISAVIFLLHKPIGLGSDKNVLEHDDPRLKTFFNLVDNNRCSHKIGFDSCTVPAIINFCKNINIDSLDTCEAARFSAYVDSDMNMMPCSFDNQDQKYSISLKDHTVEEIWNSEKFEEFRNTFRLSCTNCNDRCECYGGCPITNKITLCNRKERRHGK